MKTLIVLAIILFAGAIFENVQPSSTWDEPRLEHKMRPTVNQVTSYDVHGMVDCGSYLIMIAKASGFLSGENPSIANRMAQGWLKTAMFYSVALEDDYIGFLNESVVTSKMHSENLMGKTDVEGMVDIYYAQCTGMMHLQKEYVAFLEVHGDV